MAKERMWSLVADENQIGCFIAELRKEKGLTQKQLAEELGVTDKAVSKWERGMGYPDITMLTRLAAALGITTGELLKGAREDAPTQAPEVLVTRTFQYADKVETHRQISITRLMLAILTICSITAIAICMICDFSLNGRFTWVIFPGASIIFGWLVLAPFLYVRSCRVTVALISISIFLLPFLFLLALGSQGDWFLPVALPCALTSLALVWLVFLCQVVEKNWWRTAALFVLLAPLLNLSIELSLWRYTGTSGLSAWTLFSAALCLIAALLLFLKSRAYQGNVSP